MNDGQKYKRRKLLIDSKFQITFIVFFATLAIFSSLQIYYFGWYSLDILSLETAKLNLSPDSEFLKILAHLKSSFNILFFVSSGITFLLYIFGSLYFSNKIAGPIYRMRQQIAEFQNNNETKRPIKLREGDYFNELAEDINNILEKPN